MRRVNASLAARLAVMATDGIAQRHNLAGKPEFSGRRRLSALSRARAAT
ncbi:hypothetical protein [Pectobacterium carotovorum]